MKNVFLPLLLCALLASAPSTSAQAPIKRVLVEEFTGAWCPWCIDGPVRLDAIHEKVGDQLIAVAIHDNDSMTTDEYNKGGWKPMAPFFPAGMINRVYYADESSGKAGIDRGNWEKRVLEELAKPAVVDVFISKNKLNAATRELSVTVDASFVSDVAGDVRLNVYIVESKIVGKGTGWDQANAYNALAGNESHPWYGKGSPVKGFEHNHVFRHAMGGAWGEAGSVPPNVKAGQKSSYTFTYTIPDNWNTDNMEVVAIAEMYNSDVNKCEILNASEQELAPAPTKVSSAPMLVAQQEGTTSAQHFSVINQSDNDQTYVVSLMKSARTPWDWIATCSAGTEFRVTAHTRLDATAILNPGTTVGVGDVTVSISPKNDPLQIYATKTLTVLHKDCQSMELLLQGDKFSIHSSVTGSGRSGYWPVAGSGSTLWPEVSKLSALKNLIVNTGESAELNAAAVSAIQSYADAGANVLITGNKASSYMIANNDFANEAGISQSVESTVGVDKAGGFVTFSVEGLSDDPITAGMKMDCKLVETKLNILDFSVPPNARQMLVVAGTQKAIAADMQLFNARCVITPNPQIFGAKMDEVVSKSLTWLEANPASTKPILRTFDNVNPQMLDFGTVEVNKSKSMNYVLRNTGKSDLVIKTFDWLGGAEDTDVFSIANAMLPLTIPTGSTRTLSISCSPKDPNFVTNTVLNITSNAANAPEYSLSVVAQASASTSVEPSESGDALLRLSLAPNPSNEVVHIEMTNNTSSAAQVMLLDAMGNEITSISGEAQRAVLNTSSLASGVYRVVIRAGAHSRSCPLVVVH